jgi:hypothetical protein
MQLVPMYGNNRWKTMPFPSKLTHTSVEKDIRPILSPSFIYFIEIALQQYEIAQYLGL